MEHKQCFTKVTPDECVHYCHCAYNEVMVIRIPFAGHAVVERFQWIPPNESGLEPMANARFDGALLEMQQAIEEAK